MRTIIAYFSVNGLPATGLNPSISGTEVTPGGTTPFPDGSAMYEIRLGWYGYDFAGYVEGTNYAFLADSESTAVDLQFVPAAAVAPSSVENALELLDNQTGDGP